MGHGPAVHGWQEVNVQLAELGKQCGTVAARQGQPSSVSKVITMTDTRLITHRDVSTAMARYDDRGIQPPVVREEAAEAS
ncbi:hypothetical protein ABT120_40935 [Nonomuraea angiospora]|uniref:hypothetical protein n=1 Tax=Nonomuraea angiospora TaxID=46172 RepID=UPI00332609C0